MTERDPTSRLRRAVKGMYPVPHPSFADIDQMPPLREQSLPGEETHPAHGYAKYRSWLEEINVACMGRRIGS